MQDFTAFRRKKAIRYLSGRASRALTEAMHPAHEVLWSASLAKSCFSTTMSPSGREAPVMLPPPLPLPPPRGSRAFFFLSLAHRETFRTKTESGTRACAHTQATIPGWTRKRGAVR